MGNSNKWRDKLEAEYRKKHLLYEKFCIEIKKQIEELIRQAGIVTVFPIECRVKSWKSITDKCERFKIEPKKLNEITDVAGLRIVLLFKRDLSKVCEIIEKTFKVFTKEDAQKRLANDKFGYGSIHFILQQPDSWLNVPTLSGFKGLHAELQVRTASQHIWAAASHTLQYKHESDVPLPIRRAINRVAAQLETVDVEFERVLIERDEYVKEIEKVFKEEPLNTDSLRRTLDKLLPEENREANESYAGLLYELRALDIMKVKQLEDIIKKQWLKVKAKEEKEIQDEKEKLAKGEYAPPFVIERIKKGVLFTHTGLAKEILRREFGNKYDKIKVSTLLDVLLNIKKKAQ